MIEWDQLEAGDVIPLAELHDPAYPGNCPAEMKTPMPVYCLRERGHLGQHVAVDPAGFVMITWSTIQ